MMTKEPGRLRVALLAGTLDQGGAEKQLVYMARALHQAGVHVRVYSLTREEFHAPALRAVGIEPIWVGRLTHPLLRLAAIMNSLRRFKPHILQSTHFFTNLYVSVAARLFRMAAIGSIRNDTLHELNADKPWGQWLLRMPPTLLANSYAAKRNVEELGIKPDIVHVLPNVIDIADFDLQTRHLQPGMTGAQQTLVATVGRSVPFKRQERFLHALARARQEISGLKGVLIGDGPERHNLESLAGDLGLLSDGLQFAGRRNDVPLLLCQADMFLLTSDHEGFPNVLLEAMAARLPVITTPAGDAAKVVQNNNTGYVVPFDDIEGMAELMVRMAQSPDLRHQLGAAGRKRVEQYYSSEGMEDQIMSIYRDIARQQKNCNLLRLLPQQAS